MSNSLPGNQKILCSNLTSKRYTNVHNSSLYITDDNNMAIFPGDGGQVRTFDLTQVLQRAQLMAQLMTVFIADLVDGRLETSKTLTVRFSEFEASVMGIASKVNDALEQEDSVILTDGQGNQILDTEETRGSAFWKQNARKVCAVKEGHLQQLQGSKKRRLSRRDDNGLDAVFDTIEEVVLEAQGLQEVSATTKELTNLASSNRRTPVSLTEAEAAAVKDASACVVCKGCLLLRAHHHLMVEDKLRLGRPTWSTGLGKHCVVPAACHGGSAAAEILGLAALAVLVHH
ncbi:hypothetical protein INR49_022987, partial [Caranx melampygus]